MTRLSESQQYAADQLEALLLELEDLDPAAAAAHAISGDVLGLIEELPATLRATYADAIGKYAPGLSNDLFGSVSPPIVSPPSQWRSFPVEALGFRVGRYVTAVAQSIGCDPSMAALPALVCLAGSIGNRRVIQVKQGWTEPAVLWAAVVARSGTRKTPAVDEVMQPLRDAEAASIERYTEQRAEYDSSLQAWKDIQKEQRRDRPIEPLPPPRLVVSDVTVEALALRLSQSPQGLLLYRDELAGWVRGFDRYRGGRGGDAQTWLEMHRAGSIIIDRKTHDPLSVRRAAVSVVGTIQPGVLAACLSGENTENGLAARLLFAMPPLSRPRWSDEEIDTETRTSWATLLDELRGLDSGEEPLALPLTPPARKLFRAWFQEQAERIGNADTDAAAAAASKIEGYAARLALVVGLAANSDATEVDAEAITAGIDLARWFGAEAERIYAAMTERPGDKKRRQLIDWIRDRGGEATARDLAKGPTAYRQPGTAAAALDELDRAGYGRWVETKPGPKGGRPTRVLVLHPGGETPGGETPEHGGETPAKAAGRAGLDSGETSGETGFGVSVSPPTPESGNERDDDEGEGETRWAGTTL